MRLTIRPAILAFMTALGGCAYFPVPADPIRYVTSPSEVSTCGRLGPIGLARTDGEGGYRYDLLTTPVRASRAPDGVPLVPVVGGEFEGPNLALRLQAMRDSALALGATDLLLSRRIYHDWSYVEGIAYRCSR